MIIEIRFQIQGFRFQIERIRKPNFGPKSKNHPVTHVTLSAAKRPGRDSSLRSE